MQVQQHRAEGDPDRQIDFIGLGIMGRPIVGHCRSGTPETIEKLSEAPVLPLDSLKQTRTSREKRHRQGLE